MKILTIIGARPQFIKAAPVSAMFSGNDIEEIILNTGQHYDFNMSDIFFKELKIPSAKYNLNVGSGSHGVQTGNMLIKLDGVFQTEKPDIVLVYGDTNSTLAGALAASKFNIPIIHVESGCRSYNRSMPEELNRVITDNLSTYLFCSSEISKKNLHNEGIVNGIHVVGDVMFDIFKKYSKYHNDLNKYGEYCLLTLHRAENTNKMALEKRINQISLLNLNVICPLHPRTRNKLNEYNISIPNNIQIVNPMSWMKMMNLVKNSNFVITDSGGLQKEALWHNKFCFTLREETEWTETIALGMNTLVNLEDDINLELINCRKYVNPYGDGNSSEKIVNLISKLY